MIFASNADHIAYHNGANIKLVNDVYVAERIKYKCTKCGKILQFKTKSLCLNCYKEEKSSHIPNRKTLQNLLLTNNYSEIGRKYSVSPNAVKKWAKKYNIYEYQYFNIPREELVDKLKNNTISNVAKYYNVSSVTIRNAIKRLNITVMNNYVICINNGKIYKSATQAGMELMPDVGEKNVGKYIKQSIKNNTAYNGFKFKYLDNPVF